GNVAADRLDLQNVSALIRQKHGRERTRYHPCQIEDTNTVERAGHDILPDFSFSKQAPTNLLSSRNWTSRLCPIPDLTPFLEPVGWSVRRWNPRHRGAGPCRRTFPFQRRTSASQKLRG